MSVLPRSIRLKLDEVRETLRGYLWLQCLLMIACWFVLVFWLGAAIDYLPVRIGSSESPRWVRVGLLFLMAGGILWILLGWLLPRWMARIRDRSLALLIERNYPRFTNELVTAVELSEWEAQVADPVAHASMLERVYAKADSAIQQIETQSLFNWRPIRILRLLVIAGLVVTGIAASLQWSWFSLWSQRLFALSDQPWPRQASLKADWVQMPIPAFTGQLSAENLRLDFRDGTAHVPSGATLLLQVSADAAATKVPEVCTLYYRTDDGTRGRANLRRIGSPVGGWQHFNLDGPPLDGVNSNLTMDVIGLDARLRNLQLKVVDPIVIADLQLALVYPKYLMDSLSVRAERESLPYRAGLKIQEGTECTLVGRCNADLQEVQFVLRPIAGADSSQAPEVQKAITEKDTFRISMGSLRESQLVEIRLLDRFGLSSDQVMRYNLVVVPDLIPEVQSRLEGIGLAITPRAFLPVRGTVIDDHAVQDVFAEISVDETTLQPVSLKLEDQSLVGEVDFVQLAEAGAVELRAGMTVGLSIVAKDFYDLDQQPHVGRGQPVQLAVVSQDQLLVLLDRNELELRQRLEQIISELSQLNQALRDLALQLGGLEASALRSAVDRWRQAGKPIQDPSLSHTHHLALQSTLAAWQPTASVVTANLQSADHNPQDQTRASREAVVRMSVLRAQQAQLQTDKSRQELAGVSNRVEHLRLQLVHNRIDSLDRQQWLLEQVQTPLTRLLAGEYVGLEKHMSELLSATTSGKGQVQATLAAEVLDRILVKLEAIKESMMDIESFNELIDLVRGLLEEQERVLKQTEDTQKARILDLFK